MFDSGAFPSPLQSASHRGNSSDILFWNFPKTQTQRPLSDISFFWSGQRILLLHVTLIEWLDVIQ